ncbi:MAG TPA: hypothetical protein VNC61_01820 [Acidimicrobiales bacterium]|nr:hypothetical protein [Acidimicrobiales bacterium]
MNKVKVGFFSFTEITDPSEHRSYNEWHQLDHMPEQYPLPGMAFGQRWVSTPACRAARVVDGPLLGAVHYVTLYLMAEPVEETLEQFQALGGQLRAVGRFHQHRRALLSGPFDVDTVAAAPRVMISAEAVPYRPNRGAYFVVEARTPESAGAGSVDADVLLGCPGVAGVWSFVSDTERRGVWRPGRHRVTVCFLDTDPLDVSASLDELVGHGRPGAGAVIHAGPVETVTPWRWDWFD